MSWWINIPLTVKLIFGVAAVNNEKGACHRYVQKTAAKEIAASRQIGSQALSPLHLLKIQWYMATTLYLGELLSILRPEKLSANEKKSLIWLGALMAITDLMVDDLAMDSKKIMLLMTDEAERKRKDVPPAGQVLLLYYHRLLTEIGEEKAQTIHDFSLLKPQIDSRHQHNGAISERDVLELTRQKGGTALLLTASLLFDLNESKRKAFFQLGAFIQLMNDSQDLLKDLRNDLTTFARFQKSYEDIHRILMKEYAETAGMLQASDFPEKSVYRLLFYFHGLLVGILFKIHSYAKRTGDLIDINQIKQMDKARYTIPMFSIKSITYCVPKIIRFKKNPESPKSL